MVEDSDEKPNYEPENHYWQDNRDQLPTGFRVNHLSLRQV